MSTPRQYGCPIFIGEHECPWIYETPAMPDEFKNEPYVLRLRLGGTHTTTLSENVRESMWAAEHRDAILAATAEHLRAAHKVEEMIAQLAPVDFEAGWDDRCC